MPKLRLNPSTKKALKESEDKALFLKDYLIKNYTVADMTDIISSYYLDEAANVPKVKISQEQFDKDLNLKS